MIHTMQVHFWIETRHIEYVEDFHSVRLKDLSAYIGNRFKGLTINVQQKKIKQGISIFIDVPLLLDRGDIIEDDYVLVEQALKVLLSYTFNDPLLFDELSLTRLDYRLDVIVHEEKKRDLYIKLYSQTYRKRKSLVRVKGKMDPNGVFIKYKTNVVHFCESKSTIIYDKNSERDAKRTKSQSWEVNVIRFEVSLRTRALKYNALKDDGIERRIKYYFKRNLYERYMREYLVDIYLVGEFYTIEEAIKIIYSSQLSSTRKDGLKQFLSHVKKFDLTVPKNKMSSATFRGRLADLKALGIHPVTITDRDAKVANILPGLLKKI